MSSVPTGESAAQVQRSDRSKYTGTIGTNGHHEVSQFSYVSQNDALTGSVTQNFTGHPSLGGELPSSSSMNQFNNTSSYQ